MEKVEQKIEVYYQTKEFKYTGAELVNGQVANFKTKSNYERLTGISILCYNEDNNAVENRAKASLGSKLGTEVEGLPIEFFRTDNSVPMNKRFIGVDIPVNEDELKLRFESTLQVPAAEVVFFIVTVRLERDVK